MIGPCIIRTAFAVGLMLASAPAAFAQHDHQQRQEHGMPHGASPHQSRFDDPQRWSAVFDDPARAEWQKPDEVIRALALKPADVVADIGAGTGYFAVRLAARLPKGVVIAVDIEPRMVQHLAERARTQSIGNLRAVQGGAASPNLPEPVDVALLVDVYHHIADRLAYFWSLRASLKPDGRVAIIDYRPDAARGAPKRFRLSAGRIASEMAEAGYDLVESHDFLPYQSFQIFRRAGG